MYAMKTMELVKQYGDLTAVDRLHLKIQQGELFSATLVAKDRESALLQRLYTTPLTGLDFTVIFVLGYLAVWAVIYCITRRNTAKVNAMLKKKQERG